MSWLKYFDEHISWTKHVHNKYNHLLTCTTRKRSKELGDVDGGIEMIVGIAVNWKSTDGEAESTCCVGALVAKVGVIDIGDGVDGGTSDGDDDNDGLELGVMLGVALGVDVSTSDGGDDDDGLELGLTLGVALGFDVGISDGDDDGDNDDDGLEL